MTDKEAWDLLAKSSYLTKAMSSLPNKTQTEREDAWDKLYQTNEVYRDVLGVWGRELTKIAVNKVKHQVRQDVLKEVREKIGAKRLITDKNRLGLNDKNTQRLVVRLSQTDGYNQAIDDSTAILDEMGKKT